MKFLILNGPNLNMLGIREPDLYGNSTYEDLVDMISLHAQDIGLQVCFFQSNHEGALVDAIQKAYFEGLDGIVINPAAYTHTSIAIADALKAVCIPAVEVHISRVEEREAYRQISYVREVAIATVTGKGFQGYLEAMDKLKDHIEKNNEH